MSSRRRRLLGRACLAAVLALGPAEAVWAGPAASAASGAAPAADATAVPPATAAPAAGRTAPPGAQDAPVDTATADAALVDTLPGGEADTLPPVVPEERARADEQLEAELNATLRRIPGLADVRAGVEAGVGILTGTTPSLEARTEAEELARAAEGVVYVENRIRQVTSLGARLRAFWHETRARVLSFVAWLPLLVAALLVLAASIAVAVWLGHRERLFGRLSDSPFGQNILRQVARAAVVAAGIVLVLQLLDITALVGAVLGAAGIFGLAVGFAFRTVAENYLAGVFLSVRPPFEPNDHVALATGEGKVVRLSFRETVLMTLDGNHLRVPNATVFGSVITNYTRNPLRRFDVPVSVDDANELSPALAAGVAALRAMPGVLDDPAPMGRVEELGDGIVRLRFFGWVDQRQVDFLKVHSEAIRLVKARLEAAGVALPATAYRVLLERKGGEGRARPERAARREEAGAGDVSVDRSLDEQIEQERRRSGDPDLLEPAREEAEG